MFSRDTVIYPSLFFASVSISLAQKLCWSLLSVASTRSACLAAVRQVSARCYFDNEGQETACFRSVSGDGNRRQHPQAAATGRAARASRRQGSPADGQTCTVYLSAYLSLPGIGSRSQLSVYVEHDKLAGGEGVYTKNVMHKSTFR